MNQYTKEHIKKKKRNQMRRFHFCLLQEAQTLCVLKPLSFQELGRPFRLKTRYTIYQCTVCFPLHLLHWHAEEFCNVRGTWWNLSSVCLFIVYIWTTDVSGIVCIVSSSMQLILARSSFKLYDLDLLVACPYYDNCPLSVTHLQAKLECIYFWSKFCNGSLQQLDSFALLWKCD